MKFSGVWNVFLYFIGQCKSAYGVYFQGGDMISGKGAWRNMFPVIMCLSS